MALTSTFWTSGKKAGAVGKDGKKAPDTGLSGAIKKFETANTKMNSSVTTTNCDATAVALKSVENLLTEWLPKLQVNWPNLAITLKALQKDAVKARAQIEEHQRNLGTQTKVEKAGSQAESIYEGLWGAFEKTRLELKNSPSRAVFPKAMRELDALIKQADVVGNSDIYLKPKYNKQVLVLNGIKTTITGQERDYEQAISDCLKFRETSQKNLEAIYTALAQVKGQLTKLKTLALQAQQGANTQELAKHKKLAGMLLKSAGAKCKEGSDLMAMGTPLKNGTDWKAAKISPNDAGNFTASTTACFNANKDNLNLLKEIKLIADEISQLA